MVVAAPVSVIFIVWLGSWVALGASRWGETERLQVALVRKCVSSLLKTRLQVGHFPPLVSCRQRLMLGQIASVVSSLPLLAT